MEIKASVKNAITTPRKTRLAIDLVRGKSVTEALNILNFTSRKSAGIVKKLVESAMANAKNNYGLTADNLFIKSIEAQEGLVMKRWMPRAHGHATKILKRRSHIMVCLDEIKPSGDKLEGKKSKMKTYSYEEVQKAIKEADKAAKMVQKKDTKTAEPQKGAKSPQKEIESRPNFTRLGDRFKSLIHRTTKKG
jgi:large subunit ribosomal protein L22